jgi:hypothetical protein
MRDDVTTASRPVTATAAATATTATVAERAAVAVGGAVAVRAGVRPRAGEVAHPELLLMWLDAWPGARARCHLGAQENLVVGRSCRSPST